MPRKHEPVRVEPGLTVVELLEQMEDQRDSLYAMSVVPRRSTERALAALDRGDPDLELARDYLIAARDGLFSLAEAYLRYAPPPQPEA